MGDPGHPPRLFARYLLAGVGSFLADFAVFTLLTSGLTGTARFDAVQAHLVSRPIGGVACFLLNRRFTFRSDGAAAEEFVRFAAVFFASYLVTLGLIALFCDLLGWTARPGKLLAETLVLLFNFVALKRFTFRWRPRS